MSEALAVGTMRQAIELAMMVSLPMLLAGLTAGILVSAFQTVTSIHDNVLGFLPRAVAIFVVFALTFPWMLRLLTGFTSQIFRRLPEFIR
ncbi:MAG: flagellar biosynthetic protein FliQ [Acidobacteriota bacterium]